MARSKTKDVVNDPWDMGPSQKTSTIDDMTAMRKQLSETPDITYMNRRETNNSMLSNRSRKRIRDDRSEHDKRMDRQNSRKRNMLDNSHILGLSSSRQSISNLGSQKDKESISHSNVKLPAAGDAKISPRMMKIPKSISKQMKMSSN